MTGAAADAVAASPVPAAAATVTAALGLTWSVTQDPYNLGLDALLGLALRDNPKRAHLIVSKVLAKHIPVPPAAARAAGLLLAGLVHEQLGVARRPELTGALLTDPDRSAAVNRLAQGSLAGDPIVIGYCETATGLGHTVADAFTGATYVHTTRHPTPAPAPLLGFDEAHSHSVVQYLQPIGAHLHRHAPVVLVDDELTTGSTAMNTIEKLHAHRRYPRFVIATLLDLRAPAARAAFDVYADALGVQVDVVALLSGHLTLPDDVFDRAEPLQAVLRAHAPHITQPRFPPVTCVPRHWPAAVPFTARHGFDPSDREPFATAIDRLVVALTAAEEAQPGRLHGHGRVLVVGTEECMIAAIRLAHALELHYAQGGERREIHVQSTTRSPVLPYDADGYAIRRAVAFDCPTEPGRTSYLYNAPPPDSPAGDRPAYEHIVVLTDAPPAALSGLAEVLAPLSEHQVLLLADGSAP